MAEITVSMVKELRERTQAGMSDCKNALVEAGGNLDAAVEVILKKGLVKAAARAGRIAAEGEVRTHVSADGKRGVIVEVNCQTDFVARGDDFKGFVTKVVEVASKLPKGTDLGAQKYPGSDRTIDDVRGEMVAKSGENTVIRRWDVLECKEAGGFVHSYIHAGGKLAVLVHADAPSADAVKNADVVAFVDNAAMQIAAMSPIVVRKEEVSDADSAKQREIFDAQMKEEPKQPPAAAWQKILDGKINKWFTEVTLLGQQNVWDPAKGTVDSIRQEVSKAIGGELKLVSFVRFGLGEGIEKKTDDLAAEVAKLTT
jgi:elongation factor Ts